MLSVTSRYAFRALAHLAQLPEGEMVHGRDLASETDLPANYLSKILLSLRKAGIVDSCRGSGGGYRLQRGPADVTLFDVAKLFDGPVLGDDCLLCPGKACSPDDSCPAHREWSAITDRYSQFLKRTTLRDISQSNPRPEACVLGGAHEFDRP